MSMNQNTQGHFTSETVNQAVNQNLGMGQSASQQVFGVLPDQVIATEYLITAKTGVTGLAKAVTEAATPELRTTLKRYLDGAIAAQETIFQYMSHKGWYDAYNPQHMIEIDTQCADNAMKLQS
jgi:similar to spore coat protein